MVVVGVVWAVALAVVAVALSVKGAVVGRGVGVRSGGGGGGGGCSGCSGCSIFDEVFLETFLLSGL